MYCWQVPLKLHLELRCWPTLSCRCPWWVLWQAVYYFKSLEEFLFSVMSMTVSMFYEMYRVEDNDADKRCEMFALDIDLPTEQVGLEDMVEKLDYYNYSEDNPVGNMGLGCEVMFDYNDYECNPASNKSLGCEMFDCNAFGYKAVDYSGLEHEAMFYVSLEKEGGTGALGGSCG